MQLTHEAHAELNDIIEVQSKEVKEGTKLLSKWEIARY